MDITTTITTPDGKSSTFTRKVRNYNHFLTQLNNRKQVKESKKIYKRCRDKKVDY